MRVGDKLLCKKTRIDYQDDNYYTKIKDRYYIITGLSKYEIRFGADYFWCLDNNSAYYIWKWFYTPSEIRKLKLKQLNDAESR